MATTTAEHLKSGDVIFRYGGRMEIEVAEDLFGYVSIIAHTYIDVSQLPHQVHFYADYGDEFEVEENG